MLLAAPLAGQEQLSIPDLEPLDNPCQELQLESQANCNDLKTDNATTMSSKDILPKRSRKAQESNEKRRGRT